MRIGIGTPLPLIGNLPSQGQGGGGVTFTYVDQDYCSNASDPSPTVVPAGGTFSELDGNSGLVINATTGVIDISASTSNASYIAKYTAPDGKSANFPINISTYPAVTITGNSSVCEGAATTLTVASGYSYQWYKDSVLISGATSNTYNPDVNTVGSSVYYVIATNTFSGITCTDQSADFSFTVYAAPSVTISTVPGATICTGDTAILTANVTGGSGNYTYLWSTGATTSTISVTAAATYTVTVTDTTSTCTDQASQAITVSSDPTVIASIDNDYTLEFNGIDDYIETDFSLGTTSAFSVSMWVKTTSLTTSQILIDNRDTVADGFNCYIDTNNTLKFRINGVDLSTSTSSLSAGTWFHLGLTYDGSSKKIYLNRRQADTTSQSTTLNITNTMKIGTVSHTTPSNFFSGDIDEVAVWDTSLSACDVAGIYDATTSVNGQPKSANLLDANTTIPAPVYWNRMGD